MAETTDQEQIRLQVPVSRELADKVAELAKRVEWSQGRMAGRLLELSAINRKTVSNWMAARVRGHARSGRKIGFLQQGSTSEVRLQVAVSKEAADEIELLAQRLNHTPVRMAALLMDFAIDDNEWVYNVLSTWFGKKVLGPLVGKVSEPYESAEVPLEEEAFEEGPEKQAA